MARLIDADLMEFAAPIDLRFLSEKHFKCVLNILRSQPTVDAVPVVRCRDCKHWNVSTDKTTTWCTRLRSVETIEDDFCSFGGRRDAE